jgi:hypothetical protein
MRQALSRSRRLAVLLVFAPLGAACHSPFQASPPAPLAYDPDATVALQVANHNWLDVVIYVLRDGQPQRIGIATAASSANFVLPRRMLGQAGEIQLWGRPIGAKGGAFTEAVVVQPGQWIEWTLESDLGRSAIGVY